MRQGNDLVGLYPLIQSIGPWRALRPLGAGPSDYLAPLLRDDSAEVQQEIFQALTDLSKKHLIDLHQIPSDHPFVGQINDPISQATCLVIDLPSTFDEYLKGLSKSLRYDVRRLNGKALSEKGAQLIWAAPENINQLASSFFELHKLRWKSRGLPGAFFGKAEAFQRDWMSIAIQNNVLRMCILMANGKAVGSIYGMQQGQATYFYQAGMDPDASSLSPGTILTASLIERAIADGSTQFDLMRGDEPYKRRWKPTQERTNYRTFMGKNSVLARVGESWNRQAWRVELKLRERFEGKGLKPNKNQS